MSIKTIGKAVQSNSAGLQKRINKSAEKLVFDVLQSSQYSTPIASTVRELVTNACDSQREKEIALEILSGKKTVEDYYITRHEDEYKDSNFDRLTMILSILAVITTELSLDTKKMTVLAIVMFLVLLTMAWVSASRDSKATSNWDSQLRETQQRTSEPLD